MWLGEDMPIRPEQLRRIGSHTWRHCAGTDSLQCGLTRRNILVNYACPTMQKVFSVKQLLLIFSSFLGFLAISSSAGATSCWNPTPLQHVEATTMIFYGKVLKGSGGPADGQMQVAEFEVLRAFKGSAGKTIKVRFYNDHAALRGWGFEPGQSTLVFADVESAAEGEEALPQVHYCSMIPYHARSILHADYWDVLVRQTAVVGAPRFEDYSVSMYSGPVSAPDLSSHPDAKTYATRLRAAAAAKVNFAGEYILTTWGCGTNCIMGVAQNAKTGSVHFLPGTICCWFEAGENVEPVVFQADSILIVLTGLINEQEPMATRYYEFRDGQFRLTHATNLR